MFSLVELALVLLAIVIVGTTVTLTRIQIRKNRNKPVKAWVQGQPVTYGVRAFVRERRVGAWVDWSNRLGGGPQLLVRTRGIEVSAPQGMVLESRAVFLTAEKASMTVDRVGWAGTPLGKRDCIRLKGHDEGCGVDLAISPETGIDPAWQALVDAGVHPE
jgi:hypothetical protein